MPYNLVARHQNRSQMAGTTAAHIARNKPCIGREQPNDSAVFTM
jgi:hypothetical protein